MKVTTLTVGVLTPEGFKGVVVGLVPKSDKEKQQALEARERAEWHRKRGKKDEMVITE